MRSVPVRLLALATLSAGGCLDGWTGGEMDGVPMVEPAGESGPGNVTVTVPADDPCSIRVDFGNLPIGQTETATVRIVNQGWGALDVSLPNPTLDPEFTLNFPNQGPIVPGAHGQFTVSFNPYKVGPTTSAFTITTDGVNDLCSSGNGSSAANVTLQGNGIQLSLRVDPNPLDFGNTLINTSSKQSVTLTNTSNVAVTGITAVLSGSDLNLFQLGLVPTTLAAGDSASIEISYAPLALQVRSFADVVFAIATSDGGSQIEMTLALFGEPVGLALTVAPNPCDFGFVPVGTTQTCCTTVTNQSNVVVTIESIGSFVTASNAYAVSPTDNDTPANPISYPLDIHAGAAAKVCFTFTPPSPKQYQGEATLVTQGDPTGSDPVVQLTGWGENP